MIILVTYLVGAVVAAFTYGLLGHPRDWSDPPSALVAVLWPIGLVAVVAYAIFGGLAKLGRRFRGTK